jgi:hypothetical protein
MAPWCDRGAEGVPGQAEEVGMLTQVARLVAAEPVRSGPLAVLVVTVVLLLVVGAIFWSFLRRSSKKGVSPLEVDTLEARHLPEPADPTVLPSGTDVRGETP